MHGRRCLVRRHRTVVNAERRRHGRRLTGRAVVCTRLAHCRRVQMRITGICFCVLLGAWPVFAQNDATIIGQVKDPGGLVLPGVTVVATSPALQLPSVSAVTNENGEYRLASLPIGT